MWGDQSPILPTPIRRLSVTSHSGHIDFSRMYKAKHALHANQTFLIAFPHNTLQNFVTESYRYISTPK